MFVLGVSFYDYGIRFWNCHYFILYYQYEWDGSWNERKSDNCLKANEQIFNYVMAW